jgi:hypothetical protein
MPQMLNRGLYRVRRASTASKSVQHAAVADVGNRLGLLPRRDVLNPRAVVIVHQTPPALQYEVHQDGLGEEWTVEAQISDETGARDRLEAAKTNPTYDALGNNCEHFASFIADGKRTSPQLWALGIFTSILVLLLIVSD